MTHEEKISLIDAMVKENPDYTIKDYLELVKDIDRISIKTQAIEENEIILSAHRAFEFSHRQYKL